MSNIIKALKDNRYPFGLWPELYGEEQGRAMQAKAEEIGWPEFEQDYLAEKDEACCSDFAKGITYRLTADYPEPSEIHDPSDSPAPPLRPPGPQGIDKRF